jgi:ribosomal protein S18 acetylase RimI-like enzyme
MARPPACRPATVTDVSRIAALVQAAYRGPGGWTNEIGIVEGRRISEAQLTDLVRSEDGVVLVVDEGPAGGLSACCRVAAGDDGVASLGLLAVAPVRQGHGLGRGLVAEARTLATEYLGAHTLEISVVCGQAALLAWYGRLGFRDTGRTRPFAGDPEDRALVTGLHFVIMRMPLPG